MVTTKQTNTTLDLLNTTYLRDYPSDAARKLALMQAAQAAEILVEQPAAVRMSVWQNLAQGAMETILRKFPDQTAVELLSTMDAGPAAALLSRFDAATQTHYFALLNERTAKELRELLEYPDNTAGKLMDTKVTAFRQDISVGDAIKQLRIQKTRSLHHLYLLDESMRLSGSVDIQKIALAENDQMLASLATPVLQYVTVLDPREEVIDKLQKFDLNDVPVIDGNDMLVGVIHEHSLFASIQDNISADMQTMVGVSKDERALSSAWFAVKKRQPWLQINLLTAFLAAAVVGMFEDTIATYTALAILLPIAAGQSGNTGAQALAVTMRGLTLREITVRHWLRVTLKEAGAACINGVAIAITCGLGVFLWSSSVGLALIIALAMISSMTIAAVSGALVPIVLKRLGQDPALSSSIILTTVTDIAGFMSFLGIATTLSFMLEAG